MLYSPDINKSIYESFNIDYLEALKDPNIAFKVKNSSFKGVSIAIAAITVVYSRIHINRIKDIILEKKRNIYYFNNNSRITDIKLSLDIINFKQIRN